MNILVLSSQQTFSYYPHNEHFRIILIINSLVLSPQLYYPNNEVSYYPHNEQSRISSIVYYCPYNEASTMLTMNGPVLFSQLSCIILTMNIFVQSPNVILVLSP
jgi:hypothetical protein